MECKRHAARIMAQWAQQPQEKGIRSDEVPLHNCMEAHHGMNHGRRHRMFDLHREVQLEERRGTPLVRMHAKYLQECVITQSGQHDDVVTQRK